MTVRAYIRVSQDDRNEKRIFVNQRADIERFAAAHGMGKVVFYDHDFAESGGTLNRPDFIRFRADLRRGDIALFTDISRMTRGGVRPFFALLDEWEKTGISYHFVRRPEYTDPAIPKSLRDKMMADAAIEAEKYRLDIGVWTKASHDQQVAAGKTDWGRQKPGPWVDKDGKRRPGKRGFDRGWVDETGQSVPNPNRQGKGRHPSDCDCPKHGGY